METVEEAEVDVGRAHLSQTGCRVRRALLSTCENAPKAGLLSLDCFELDPTQPCADCMIIPICVLKASSMVTNSTLQAEAAACNQFRQDAVDVGHHGGCYQLSRGAADCTSWTR